MGVCFGKPDLSESASLLIADGSRGSDGCIRISITASVIGAFLYRFDFNVTALGDHATFRILRVAIGENFFGVRQRFSDRFHVDEIVFVGGFPSVVVTLIGQAFETEFSVCVE